MSNERSPALQIEAPTRPVVYDFATPPAFLRALAEYYRRTDIGFSIRKKLKGTDACSPATISLVLNEQRRLTRDLFPVFAQVFNLTSSEVEYIDGLLKAQRPFIAAPNAQVTRPPERAPRNHLLNDWLNVYVKDCVHLRSFQPSAATVYRLLGGVAPARRIQRSIDFLYREGFWRKTQTGKTVPDENTVVTSSGLPVPKIRQFHKAALNIAKEGLDRYPPGRRKAYSTIISVDKDSLEELRTLVDRFHKDLRDFIEKHPEGRDQLCQVTIHMTPLGGPREP